MNDSVLTICIPIYNSSDVCHRAIDSALNQDTNKEYKVLIVDDNSNLQTKEVLKQYSSKPKVEIIHNENNLGLVGNWNKCLESVESKFLTFLHHDDEFLPGFVSEFYRLQAEFDDADMFILNGTRSKYECETVIEAKEYKAYIYEMFAVPAPTGVAFRKPQNIKYDEEFKYCPETDLYLNMLDQNSIRTVYSCNNLCVRHNWNQRVTNTSVGDLSQYSDQLKIGKKYQNSKGITTKNRYQLIKNFKRKIDRATVTQGTEEMYKIYKQQLKSSNFLDLSYLKTIPLRFYSPKFVLYNIMLKTNILKFLLRAKIVLNIVLNIRKEPHANFKNLTAYLFRGGYYPEIGTEDFSDTFDIDEEDDFYVVIWEDRKIYYPIRWSLEKVRKNFNAALNEQRKNSPHKYPENSEIRKGSVIYDFGAAEGLQSLIWLDVASKIYIFEPEPLFFKALQKTFNSAMEEGKVVLVPKGVSEKKEVIQMYDANLELDTLENIGSEYDLSLPDFVKADIEGQERNLLKQLKSINAKADLVICNYHKPDDEVVLKQCIKDINSDYNIRYSPGVVFFNRDAFVNPPLGKSIHPVVRKSLVMATLNKAEN